jgi:general secretion pathway protein B
MSYILDALKKSEQERGHGNIPGVQTVHSSSLNYRNDKKAYWPYILIIAVILNLLAITYFIINKEKNIDTKVAEQDNTAIIQTTTEDNTTAKDTELTATTSSAVTDNENVGVAEPLADTAVTADDKVVAPTSPPIEPASNNTQVVVKAPVTNTRPETTVRSSGTEIVDFHDLPESIKQQLPAIIISAHVYSSNPLQRSVVINNNFTEEGEYVLDGLILHEITSDGAVFNYQGTLFNYGVVSGWQ